METITLKRSERRELNRWVRRGQNKGKLWQSRKKLVHCASNHRNTLKCLTNEGGKQCRYRRWEGSSQGVFRFSSPPSFIQSAKSFWLIMGRRTICRSDGPDIFDSAKYLREHVASDLPLAIR